LEKVHTTNAPAVHHQQNMRYRHGYLGYLGYLGFRTKEVFLEDYNDFVEMWTSSVIIYHIIPCLWETQHEAMSEAWVCGYVGWSYHLAFHLSGYWTPYARASVRQPNCVYI